MGALATSIPGASKVVQALPSGKIDSAWLDTSTFFATVVDSTFAIIGNVDATKRIVFQADTLSTGLTLTYDPGIQTANRVLSAPVLTADATLAVLTEVQTFSGAKTFSAALTVSNATEATTVSAAAGVIIGGLGVALRSFLGTVSAAFKGNVLAGVQDGTAAAVGQVGQVLSSTVTGVAVAASGAVGNVTSVALTPGDWLISSQVVITGGATGLSNASTVKMSVVTTTATNGTSGSTMTQESVFALLANGLFELAIPQVRVNISANTTYYMTSEVTYVAGSPTASGTLIATRMR